MARVVGLAHENLKEVSVGIFSSIRHFFIHQVDTSNAVSWVCAGDRRVHMVLPFRTLQPRLK